MFALVAALVALCFLVGVVAAVWLLIRHIDHRQRIERREAGMSEVPKDKARRKKPDIMPEDIQDLIGGFDSPEVVRGLEEDAWDLRKGGAPWKEIKRRLVQQLTD